MNLQELNKKRQQYATFVKWGLVLLAIALAPFIMWAVKNLAIAAAAGAVGLAIVNFAPAVAMKFANWKLKAIKAEATKNPIETLQNVFRARTADKNAFRERITAFRSEVSGFADKVDLFKTQFPKDAERYVRQLEGMRNLLKRREQKYLQVKAELEQFELEIQRADAIWKMSLAAQAMNEAAGMESEDVYAKIKTETAIESVQQSLNLAFSEMETDLLESQPYETYVEIPSIQSKAADPLQLPIATRVKETTR